MDESRFLFTDLTDEARQVKPSYYFMMRSLLHSRIDIGETSDEEHGEEDVNVYLAHLLRSFSDPAYLEESRPFLHRYDHEVFGRLARSTDARLKYRIYKTNADFLLVSIGIFDDPGRTLMGRVPGAGAGAARKGFEPSEEAVMGRGRTYYQFAYSYSQMVHRERPAITEVLEKLSQGFDRYTRILAHLRGEYMDIVHELSRGEVYHLERSLNSESRREALHERQDDFLDAYAQWKRSGSEEARESVERAAAAVRELDPEFNFRLERGDPQAPDDDSADKG